MTSELLADVYISPAVSMRRPDGQVVGTWSPIACTLIHGPKSAVLVNAPFTTAETEGLADWISSTLGKKKLKAVYVSHGVHDFLLGLPTLRKRFPGVKTFCTQETLDAIKQSLKPKVLAAFAAQFPAQIDEQPPIEQAAELLPPSNELEVDGHKLQAIVAGQGAVENSTIIWVPSLRLAVCGTVVYGSVHLMQVGAATKEKRNAWIAAIEKVEQLGPTSVVAAHQKPGEIHGVWHLQRTKDYLKNFGEMVESGQVKNAKELSTAMMEKYPDRFNTGALVVSSRAAFPKPTRL
jgi:glyoxylase-like metal-dependent hydrolase (beta-lactamase superfamily II)